MPDQYEPRKHLLSETANGALVQLSEEDVFFRKAYFYPYKAVADNAPPTENAADVLLGEKEGEEVFCKDTISPGSSPIVVAAAENRYLNLKDFWAYIGTNGDKVFVVYQP